MCNSEPISASLLLVGLLELVILEKRKSPPRKKKNMIKAH